MELVDRYLQAVRFWLPSGQKQDVVAELSDDIRSEIEEREADLGRELNEAELEAILTRWGHPMAVAERYLPQRYLIGPSLLPFYAFTLKMLSTCFLGAWLIVWMCYLVFDPEYARQSSWINGLSSFWHLALYCLAFITVLFVVSERVSTRSRQNWNPRKYLAELGADPNLIPRSRSIGDVFIGSILVWWWLIMGPPAREYAGEGLRIDPWPLSPVFYWLILFALAAGLAMACLNLLRPSWTPRRSALRLALDAFALILVCLLLARPLVEVTEPGHPKAAGLHEISRWANLTWYVTLGLIGTGFLARALQDARRMVGKTPVRHWAVTFMAGE